MLVKLIGISSFWAHCTNQIGHVYDVFLLHRALSDSSRGSGKLKKLLLGQRQFFPHVSLASIKWNMWASLIRKTMINQNICEGENEFNMFEGIEIERK